jgi:hypothetical protein
LLQEIFIYILMFKLFILHKDLPPIHIDI